ncbi:MAG: hypothetical protein FWH11_12045 [Micrococcales bacterium]|nr:hypothetical protein [Micrococcales bacterium]
MARNSRLDEAVAIFVELGWAEASFADAPTLPLGTEAQQKAVLAGLRTGDLDQWWYSMGTWRAVRSRVDGASTVPNVDAQMLGLFAIRVGLDARRAVAVMTKWPRKTVPEKVLAEILAQRDRSFAQGFVDQVSRWEHVTGSYGRHVVRLVTQHNLPVPEGLGYLERWDDQALSVLVGDPRVRKALADEPRIRAEVAWRTQPEIDAELLRTRFVDHVRAYVEVGLDSALVLLAGVHRGWLDRDAAASLVLTAIDTAIRPVDRKTWLGAWLDGLSATDEEIVARADTLVPVMAAGGAPAVERLAPVLIAGVDDDLLVDVATVALTVPTKKALRVVLKALAARPRPSVEAIGSQVMAVDVGHDKSLAKAVRTVVDSWGLGEAAGPAAPVEGLWRPVPPLWTAVRFDHGEETPEALTQVAVELSSQSDPLGSVLAEERLLAAANAVARRSPELARAALVGYYPAEYWDDLQDPTSWRDRRAAVLARLGQVPCLLSEPSTVDLRVHPADLATRLRAYHEAGASASEADLLLALTRLDVDQADEATQAGLESLTVPVLLPSGDPMALTAGPAVVRYLADPVVERTPGGTFVKPASLRDFPTRLGDDRDLTVFPTRCAVVLALSDSAWIRFNAVAADRLGLVTRRATPLPPDTVANLLLARHLDSLDYPFPCLAATQAWERGLLRPGPPGVPYYQADDPTRLGTFVPCSLAAAVRGLRSGAQDGMLAVVWQILDDLAGLAASGPRLAAGAVDVAETIATLLPETTHAVTVGMADPAVLDLPGVRALAARPGTSRAVTIAREIVATLLDAAFVSAEPPVRGFEDLALSAVDDATLTVVAEDHRVLRGD